MSKLRIILEFEQEPREINEHTAAVEWNMDTFVGDDVPPAGVLAYEKQIAQALHNRPETVRKLGLAMAADFLNQLESLESEKMAQISYHLDPDLENMVKTILATLPKEVREYAAHRYLLFDGLHPLAITSGHLNLQRIIIADEQGEVANVNVSGENEQ